MIYCFLVAQSYVKLADTSGAFHNKYELLHLDCAGIRLSTFDAAKKLLTRSEAAYQEEVVRAQ